MDPAPSEGRIERLTKMMIPSVVLSSLMLLVAVPQEGSDLDAARALAERGDVAGATEMLGELAGTDGEARVPAAIFLSELQATAGQPEEAIATLDALQLPNDPDVALAMGRRYLAWADALHAGGANGDDVTLTLMDAQSHIERSVEHAAPGDFDALVELGYVKLYRFNDHVTALDMAKGALTQAPNDGNLHLLKGCANVYVYWGAKSAGDNSVTDAAYAETVADLEKAASLLPRERVEAHGQLAWIHGDRGDAVKAVDAAIQVVDRQQEPDFTTLYNMAKSYSLGRQFDASSKALEKMVSISAREITNRLRQEPDLDAMATELAWSVGPFVQRQDQATARAILQAITAAGTKSPDVWHNYAVMCEGTRRFEDALTAYQKSVDLDPENPRYYNDLGALLHHQLNRELDRAKEMYQICIEKADEQLVAVNLSPEIRAELSTARNIAQGSLDQLAPPSSGGGLLDGLLDGLSSLELPDLGGGDDEEGEEEDSATETEADAEPADVEGDDGAEDGEG